MPKTGTTTQRKYGWAHAKARRRYAPLVAAGNAWCTEPRCLMTSRWIPPGSSWDLAHNRTTGEYRGPAHTRCNRSEGATHGNRHRKHPHRTQRAATTTTAPTRWTSGRWL